MSKLKEVKEELNSLIIINCKKMVALEMEIRILKVANDNFVRIRDFILEQQSKISELKKKNKK